MEQGRKDFCNYKLTLMVATETWKPLIDCHTTKKYTLEKYVINYFK